MTEQSTNNNIVSEANFWLTQPLPNFIPSITPIYNVDYGTQLIHPCVSLYNNPTQRNTMVPYNGSFNYINYQNQYVPYNQNISNSFPPLPDNIDQEYILAYLCPVPKTPKDATNVWIENWVATKEKKVVTQNVKTNNIKINEISNNVKACKQLLENLNYSKQLMERKMSIMNKAEWKNACSNLFSIKKKIDMIVQTLNLDNNSICELKFKLTKRNKKRNRLKRLKSDLKMIKSQKRDEIIEINRKIDAWQNTLKENIMKEKRANETKIEANCVLKGVRGKIDDAKNQLLLFDTLEQLRKCRLQNCANKRKNSLLEESLNKLKILWQQKLTDYHKEEENLKNMLSKAEEEKHEKREIQIQENLAKWDKILFGSHEVLFDNSHSFLDIRKSWDKYVVNENETPASSSIPVGWIIPSMACNSEWAKYSNV